MRILVEAPLLFDGNNLNEGMDLTIENGVVHYGRKFGTYDEILEADAVIPGLIDSHVHLIHEYRPNYLNLSVRNVISLFIMHGVIAVRDTGNYLGVRDLFCSISDDLEIITTTYTVEKPPLNHLFMRMIKDSNDIPTAVERAKVEGCKWFKLYNNVDTKIAEIAVKEAHEKKLKITCHLDGLV